MPTPENMPKEMIESDKEKELFDLKVHVKEVYRTEKEKQENKDDNATNHFFASYSDPERIFNLETIDENFLEIWHSLNVEIDEKTQGAFFEARNRLMEYKYKLEGELESITDEQKKKEIKSKIVTIYLFVQYVSNMFNVRHGNWQMKKIEEQMKK